MSKDAFEQPGRAPDIQLTVAVDGEHDRTWVVEGVGNRGLFMRHGSPLTSPHLPGKHMRLTWQDGSGATLLEISGQVRDSDQTGVRLQFPGLDDATVSRIQALSRRPVSPAIAAVAPPPSANGRSQRQLDVVAHGIRFGLARSCESLMEHARSGLEQMSADNSAEVTKMPARMAGELISNTRKRITEQFCQRLLSQWTERSDQRTTVRHFDSLQLVDECEMQIWLTRRESARLIERKAGNAWQRLRPLLMRVVEAHPGLDPESLSVDAILEALVLAFDRASLEPALQHYLLRLCEQPAVLNLAGFYEELLIDLQRSGVRVQAFAHGSGTGMSVHMPGGQLAGKPAAVPLVAPGVRLAPTPEHALDATHRILALGRSAPPPATQLPATSPQVSDFQLLRAMRELVNAPVSRATTADEFRDGVEKRAAAIVGSSDAKPDPRQVEAIDLMARLQQAFDQDPLLPASFRTWSRPLLAPILATQLQPAGLAESGDALRQLFSLIEFGSVLCAERHDTQARDIRAGMDRVLSELAQAPTLHPQQLTQACEQLELLLQRHRKAGSATEERVIDACVGQQRLVDARQFVAKELAVLFGGRSIPTPLVRVLEDKLTARLVLVVLQQSASGKLWPSLLANLENLDHALRIASEGPPAIDADHYLDWIRELFPGDASDSGAPLYTQLQLLKGALEGRAVEWVAYSTRLADVTQEPAPPAGKDAGTAHARQVALLQSGDWIAFGPAGKDPRLLKLAWRAPDLSRFVFVSQLGHKADELGLDQLEAAFRDNTARVVDEGSASIIERAWRRMLEEMHDELAQQATHDPLTGLYNRKELDRRLLGWVSGRERSPLAVIWLGVDHLRVINQAHGMGCGDRVLRELANTVERHIGPKASNGYAARMAGDEFVLVLLDIAPAEADRRAHALLDQLNALELDYEGTQLRLSVSLGLLIADESCISAERLLADAERACRAAKDSGRGRMYRHQTDDSRLSQMRETVTWVGRVEQSLQTNALVLYAQRALSLSADARKEPDYVEVLLRMRSAEGVAAPGDFIIAAERYGQIKAVDRFVLQDLTRLLQKAGSRRDLRIAFNVSARNIVDPAFIEEVVETLQQQPLPLSQLCIELTETAAIQELGEASAGMKRLSETGLALVLDDFGSGWSSYQYLRRLPFDIVKVDGAFIRDIAHSAEDLAMARSINEIAHLLGKRTVAEHVEDQATLDHVRAIGFDYAQGYFVGMPGPLAAMLQSSDQAP